MLLKIRTFAIPAVDPGPLAFDKCDPARSPRHFIDGIRLIETHLFLCLSLNYHS